MGNKSKYETYVKPYLQDIKIWTETLTDEQIAEKLKVSRRSFAKYKKDYPELAQAIEDGKKKLVKILKDTLKKKAQGFYYEEVERGGLGIVKIGYPKINILGEELSIHRL